MKIPFAPTTLRLKNILIGLLPTMVLIMLRFLGDTETRFADILGIAWAATLPVLCEKVDRLEDTRS